LFVKYSSVLFEKHCISYFRNFFPTLLFYRNFKRILILLYNGIRYSFDVAAKRHEYLELYIYLYHPVFRFDMFINYYVTLFSVRMKVIIGRVPSDDKLRNAIFYFYWPDSVKLRNLNKIRREIRFFNSPHYLPKILRFRRFSHPYYCNVFLRRRFKNKRLFKKILLTTPTRIMCKIKCNVYCLFNLINFNQ